jgi:hypothetical protein
LEGEFKKLPPTPSLNKEGEIMEPPPAPPFLSSLIWRESLRNFLQLPLSTKREVLRNRRRDQIKKEYRNYAGD